MVRVTLSLTNQNQSTNVSSTRSLGDINPNYVMLTGGVPSPTALPYKGTTQYTSFAEWADEVARGVNSLTETFFTSSSVQATWNINEELID